MRKKKECRWAEEPTDAEEQKFHQWCKFMLDERRPFENQDSLEERYRSAQQLSCLVPVCPHGNPYALHGLHWRSELIMAILVVGLVIFVVLSVLAVLNIMSVKTCT